MKNIKNIIKVSAIGLLTLVFIPSCDKKLDLNSSDYVIDYSNYYTSEEDLRSSLRGAYGVMASVYSDNLQGRMGLEADEGFITWEADLNTVAYYVASPQDPKIFAYWRGFYNGINLVNALLENIDKPDINEEIRKDIKGQALFLRGYFYFMLVNKFGGVPLILKPTKDGGLEDTQVPRASIKEVYDQVLADMTAAADMVKDVSEVNGGGELSKSAVWGILARVCIYMAGAPLNDTEKYKDVLKWTTKVMDEGNHTLLPSYQQVFVNYAQDLYDTRESIWEVEFWGNGTGLYANVGGRVGLNNGIFNSSDANIGVSGGHVRPTQWLQENYVVGDLRKDWNTPTFVYQGNPGQRVVETRWWYRNVGKFRRESEILRPKSSARSPQNAPILRYSDVLLMYAEALNEINYGSTVEALNEVNKVRRRGFGVDIYTPNTAIDIPVDIEYSEFKQELMNERARELCFEGLRKNDLVRWGLLYQNIRRVFNDRPIHDTSVGISTQSVYTNVGERDVLWPIPTYEMQLNKKLTQNRGW